jgi:2-hydroxy-3-oxopropionate reductase
MKIGFIGLGIMGRPMSKNLLKAGYELVIYDRNKWKRDEVIKEGAEEGTSPKDVASRSDVIITMLPNSPQVKEVVLGNGGVIEGAKEGSILIDMSSIAPLASREVSEKLAEKKIRMMDAPVSGGEPKAIDGTLSIMVGGEEKDFEECLPILKTMGSSAVLCGEIGAGNVTKLANQIMVAVNIAGMSEALVLAAKSGVSPEKVYNAVRGGLAGSTVLDAKAPLIMDRKFDPGFRIDLHIKDLGNVIETGHGVGVPLPLTSSVMEMFQALKVDGLGSEDHGALVKFYEKLSHIEVTR